MKWSSVPALVRQGCISAFFVSFLVHESGSSLALLPAFVPDLPVRLLSQEGSSCGIFSASVLLYGGQPRFELSEARKEALVFPSQHIIFLLEALAHGLEGDITLDFVLLEELNAALELGELRLLTFAKCTLCGPVWLTI
jgi:hypothetical protein